MAEENDTFSLVENPDYAPLWSALAPVLEAGTRRIYLWDGNHMNSEPREIMADAGLYRLANRYGRPLYVSEALSGDDMVERYVDGGDDERSKVDQELADLSSNYVRDKNMLPAYAGSMIDLLQLAHHNMADVLGPDPRANQPGPSYTPAESAIGKKFFAFMREKGGIGAIESETLSGFLRDLTREEATALMSYADKLKAFAAPESQYDKVDTSVTDREINRIVDSYRSVHNIGEERVQVMLYGLGHYTKLNDLDDAHPGISILIADKPGAFKQFGALLAIDDKPDYVWYANDNRLVKLDNPAAIQEMMGIENTPLPARVPGPAGVSSPVEKGGRTF